MSVHSYFEQLCIYDLNGNLNDCEPTDERLRQQCSGSSEHLVRRIEIIELGGRVRSSDIIDEGLTCRHILFGN